MGSALLLGGALLLYFGAGWLVRGAAGLAARMRIPPLVVGLTVVAYGTSAPEVVVGVGAALTGRGEIAFGNAIGSNVANIGLILGLTALVKPPKVDPLLLRRELPVMVLTALLVPILLLDGEVSRIEGACLILGGVGYTYAMIRGSRSRTDLPRFVKAADHIVADVVTLSAAPQAIESTSKLVVIGALGLVTLLAGGKWFVDGATSVALALGLSERLIGLTVVAIGTSLPELATALVAAKRGHSSIAIGNVVGSNIFNVLLVLGTAGLAGPIYVPLRVATNDVIALVVMTLLGAVFLRGDRKISRREGALLVVGYAAFLAVVIATSR